MIDDAFMLPSWRPGPTRDAVIGFLRAAPQIPPRDRVAAGEGPTLALLVDHDDAEREFAYVSSAETFAEPQPITEVASRAGWTVASMARDWEVVFGPWG